MPQSSLERWQVLYDHLSAQSKLRGEDSYDQYHPPSDADLDRFEAGFSCRLPASYRDFIRVFGAGDLGGVCDVEAPRYSDNLPNNLHLGELNSGWNLELVEYILSQDPVPHGRIVLFGKSFGGDSFGWDLGDVTDPDAPEYGIYVRVCEEQRFQRAAGDFWDFVNDFLLNREGIRRIIPFGDEASEPEIYFTRW